MPAVFHEGVARKTFVKGTHRTLPPEQTIARMLPLLSAFGVTRIANLTGLDRIGVPVVMVCRPNSRSSAVFHGKGVDMAAAKASGIMEAIETWHAEHMQLPLRLGSLTEVRQACNVADVGNMASTTATRFHANLPILWVEGDDLFSGRRTWVPYETVHMNATLPEPQGSGCFAASTNGLASGNHLLEATSHALCEVVERDSLTLWRRRSPATQDQMRLDLSSVRNDACQNILNRFLHASLDAVVWDVTSELGIPAFQCLVSDATGEISHIGQGSGCHPAADIALLRALTEAVQVRTTYIVGSREDIKYADYHHTTLAGRNRSARALMRPVESMRDFASIASFEFADLKAEVDWILRRLGEGGIRQAIAVDLTQPVFGIPVVRVVVPGLEGSDHLADYSPGVRARAIERDPT